MNPLQDPCYPVSQSTVSSKLFLSSINFVNKADPIVIKLKIGSTPVDISIGQFGGLFTLDFIQEFAKRIGKRNLLKKSILLLKCWLTFDAALLGSHTANMTTYALYILVIFLLNNFHDELDTPLDVFRKFFEYFSDFDWNSKILTIYGPVVGIQFNKRNIEEQALEERMEDSVLKHKQLLVKPALLKERHQMYEEVRRLQSEGRTYGGKEHNHANWSKPIKIADPCIAHNNLGKSMSIQNYNRFKEAIKMQNKQLKRLRGMASHIETEDSAMAASKYFQELLWMFKYSFENTGVHPSLATKLSQIVIRRDDLCENFNHLNLPQGVSAQASRETTNVEEDRK